MASVTVNLVAVVRYATPHHNTLKHTRTYLGVAKQSLTVHACEFVVLGRRRNCPRARTRPRTRRCRPHAPGGTSRTAAWLGCIWATIKIDSWPCCALTCIEGLLLIGQRLAARGGHIGARARPPRGFSRTSTGWPTLRAILDFIFYVFTCCSNRLLAPS